VKVVAGHNSQIDSQEDCRKGWKHSRLQSDNNKFSRRVEKNRNMATEGHGHGGKKNHHQQKKNLEMDLELAEVRARIEKLALRMQRDTKTHWVYEWTMKRKVKWPVKKLLARR
jgi:hypothetical protein